MIGSYYDKIRTGWPPTDPASVEAMTDGYPAHTRLFAPSFAKALRLSAIWIDGSKYSFGPRMTGCAPLICTDFHSVYKCLCHE